MIHKIYKTDHIAKDFGLAVPLTSVEKCFILITEQLKHAECGSILEAITTLHAQKSISDDVFNFLKLAIAREAETCEVLQKNELASLIKWCKLQARLTRLK